MIHHLHSLCRFAFSFSMGFVCFLGIFACFCELAWSYSVSIFASVCTNIITDLFVWRRGEGLVDEEVHNSIFVRC